ncbi:MAG: M16 family metallopeptidase [Promethearchaeota archaeon]
MATINGNYREFRLDNGLFVALQETPTLTVSGRLRVWHGALNEEKREAGIAHFLEHTLMTGGSQKYDPERADEIRGTFGSFNAFTGLERTFFPVDMLAEDSQLFLEYVSDAAFNPRFEASRVEEERQRVLRETADAKSNPGFKDSQAYGEAFFGKNSPHTYFILGNEAVVGSASVNTLKGFHERGYHPNNMDLILVGALPKNIEDIVQQNFGQFQSGNGKKVEFPRNPQLYGATVLHTSAPELYNHENPEQSSAQLSISLVAPTETDEDSYAISMLVNILGGDANSRLFQSVSQRKGLAYGVGAQYDGSNNKGVIYIGGSVHSVRADEAIDAIFEEMAKLRTDLVSQESLERLKRNSRYNIAKTLETNAGYVHAIELRMDKGLTPEYHLERMDAVTPEKIREVAVKYLPQNRVDGKYVLSLRDPLKK